MIDSSLSQAEEAQLKYVSDDIDGIKRFKSDKSFIFLGSKAEKIKDRRTIERINSLAIPPAWKNVWISPFANSHLQATGFDEKGRKQYRYHPKWIEATQQNKFDKMLFFGKTLPTLRRKIRQDMGKNGLSIEKIIATVVWLLEHTFIRVGNSEYAKENNSFGLTTLRNKHVKVRGSNIKFQFKGKSGVMHSVQISDKRIAGIIKRCIELPGFELFQYVDQDGEIKIIDSADVNDYLKAVTGEEITAKEFRTWGGTVLSATTLHQLGDFDSDGVKASNIKQTIKVVASHLRNTPKVCLQYYIHPTVINTYEKKLLVPFFNTTKTKLTPELTINEFKVMNLLQKYPV